MWNACEGSIPKSSRTGVPGKDVHKKERGWLVGELGKDARLGVFYFIF